MATTKAEGLSMNNPVLLSSVGEIRQQTHLRAPSSGQITALSTPLGQSHTEGKRHPVLTGCRPQSANASKMGDAERRDQFGIALTAHRTTSMARGQHNMNLILTRVTIQPKPRPDRLDARLHRPPPDRPGRGLTNRVGVVDLDQTIIGRQDLQTEALSQYERILPWSAARGIPADSRRAR